MNLFLNYARSTGLYRKLCAVSASGEGNLLERTEDGTAQSQTEFLRWAVSIANPKIAIETGTNKGFFLYLLSLLGRPVTVHTYDFDPLAGRGVDLVNTAQKLVTGVFHLGDSRMTLREFAGPADFAWIDGGHDLEISLSDLLQCYRIRIPYVAVDDVNYPSVRAAVDYLLNHAPYTMIANPFGQHDRRGAVLLRLDEKRSGSNGDTHAAE